MNLHSLSTAKQGNNVLGCVCLYVCPSAPPQMHFFRRLLFGAQNIFDAYSLSTPLSQAINNDQSLTSHLSLLLHIFSKKCVTHYVHGSANNYMFMSNECICSVMEWACPRAVQSKLTIHHQFHPRLLHVASFKPDPYCVGSFSLTGTDH